MKIISFMWFKRNCIHLDYDYDFNKSVCRDGGHKVLKTFAVDPETKKKYFYHPCQEKYCPVLGLCKTYVESK